MKFLEGAELKKVLSHRVRKSRSLNIAVAFWGDGAPEKLGLLTRVAPLRIICNLAMGGTNPNVIESLLERGIDVRQSDRLHGKVYLFDNEAIVGSSNASANGLSLQGDEVEGWLEANVLVDDPGVIKDIASWFENLPTREIKPRDLANAKEAWSRRRRAGIGDEVRPRRSLVQDLAADPILFKDRRIFVCIYSEALSGAAQKELSRRKKDVSLKEHSKGSERLSAFQWPELPDFADLVCFWQESNGAYAFDGRYRMPERREEVVLADGTEMQLCWAIDSVAGYSKIGPISMWKAPLREMARSSPGGFMDIGAFGKRFLGPAVLGKGRR